MIFFLLLLLLISLTKTETRQNWSGSFSSFYCDIQFCLIRVHTLINSHWKEESKHHWVLLNKSEFYSKKKKTTTVWFSKQSKTTQKAQSLSKCYDFTFCWYSFIYLLLCNFSLKTNKKNARNENYWVNANDRISNKFVWAWAKTERK